MCDLAELLAESQAWKLSSKRFIKVTAAPGTPIASYLYDDGSESVPITARMMSIITIVMMITNQIMVMMIFVKIQ